MYITLCIMLSCVAWSIQVQHCRCIANAKHTCAILYALCYVCLLQTLPSMYGLGWQQHAETTRGFA
jgi:hypothetical protein